MRKPVRPLRGKTPRRRVTLARALSKYGIASRAEARLLILRGDVG